MTEPKVSLTALLTAYARGYHALHDQPKIFNDHLINQFFTEQEHAYFAQNLAESLKFLDPDRAASCPDPASALAAYMQIQGGPVTLSRSRYTEDALLDAVKQGVQQYVMLGAGMDTFAFRYPEVVKHINVFEVDQPATQAFKCKRLAELGWAIPERLHFIGLDFAHESLHTALQRATYKTDQPAFFSWLGVTYYLSKAVVMETLQTIATFAAPGTVLVFDYMDPDAFVPERASKRMQKMQQIVRGVGEPMKASFDPTTLAPDLANLGLRLVENLSPATVEARYFTGRSDNYHAFEHFYFAQAVVTGKKV